MTEAVDQLEVVEAAVVEEVVDNDLRNEVIVTLDGRDIATPMDSLMVTMESTPREILEAVSGIIEEAEGTRDGYQDAYGDFTYTVRKAMNSNTIYVYPKPVAGENNIEICINDRVKVVGGNKQIIINELVGYLQSEGFLVLANQMV